MIKLTNKAHKIEADFFEISKSLNEKLHSNLSEEEGEILEKLLSKIIKE